MNREQDPIDWVREVGIGQVHVNLIASELEDRVTAARTGVNRLVYNHAFVPVVERFDGYSFTVTSWVVASDEDHRRFITMVRDALVMTRMALLHGDKLADMLMAMLRAEVDDQSSARTAVAAWTVHDLMLEVPPTYRYDGPEIDKRRSTDLGVPAEGRRFDALVAPPSITALHIGDHLHTTATRRTQRHGAESPDAICDHQGHGQVGMEPEECG